MQPFTFFISYRRDNSAPVALLLKYEIEKRMQFVRVFVDVEGLHQGEHFPTRLNDQIDKSNATIALIGKNWMHRVDDNRIDRTDIDWVVEELRRSYEEPVLGGDAQSVAVKRTILPIFMDCPASFSQFHLPEQISYLASLHSERIDYATWPRAIGPLVEKLATNLGLKKRPDADEYPEPGPAKARTQPVPDGESRSILGYDDYDGWYLDNFGNAEVTYLTKIFKFKDFDEAAEFMARVSAYCKTLNHHPEWRNVYNHVTVSLTTWDARRRVTIYDLNLALYMNKAAEAVIGEMR